jgi:hypothetical protein
MKLYSPGDGWQTLTPDDRTASVQAPGVSMPRLLLRRFKRRTAIAPTRYHAPLLSLFVPRHLRHSSQCRATIRALLVPLGLGFRHHVEPVYLAPSAALVARAPCYAMLGLMLLRCLHHTPSSNRSLLCLFSRAKRSRFLSAWVTARRFFQNLVAFAYTQRICRVFVPQPRPASSAIALSE